MKITIDTKTLREALSKLASMPSATTDHISTHCVSISAEDEFSGATISRTTPSGVMTLSVVCEIQEPGSGHLSIFTLSGLVSSFKGSGTSIQRAVKDRLEIRSGKAKVMLSEILKADRPLAQSGLHTGQSATISAASFAKALKDASTAASRDRKELMCVVVGAVHEKLAIYACDGRRANVCWPEWDSVDERIEASFAVFPIGSVAMAEKCFSGSREKGTITNRGQYIEIKTASDSLLVLACDFHGLPIEAIVPREKPEESVLIDRAEIVGAMKSAIPICDANDKSMRLTIKGSLAELRMKSLNGEFEQQIEMKGKGRDIDIFFNPQFMKELIEFTGEHEILELGLGSSQKTTTSLVSSRSEGRFAAVALVSR